MISEEKWCIRSSCRRCQLAHFHLHPHDRQPEQAGYEVKDEGEHDPPLPQGVFKVGNGTGISELDRENVGKFVAWPWKKPDIAQVLDRPVRQFRGYACRNALLGWKEQAERTSDQEHRHARQPRFDRQSEFEKIDPIQLLDIKRDLDIGEIDFATGKESRRVSISRRNQDSNTRLARDSKPLATMYVAVFLAHIFFEREVFDPFRLECSREVRADLVIFGDLRMWVPPIPMEIADDRRK
jgi:hypothetical protein